MSPKDLQDRTKEFALEIIKLVRILEKDSIARIIGKQILRSATSVAANYRAACRAKSAKDFISKLGTVVEESDESLFWLELLRESGMATLEQVKELTREANEITAIMTASRSSAIKHQKAK